MKNLLLNEEGGGITSLPSHARREFEVSSNRADAKSIHYRWS